MAHPLLTEHLAHPPPDLRGDRVEVGVRAHGPEPLGEEARLLAALTMHADVIEEAQLVLRAVDVQVPAVAITSLADALDPGEDVEPAQEPGQVIDEAPAGGSVVDPTDAALGVVGDA